ncbi:hypothetical protein A2U01_0045976, partial [Trifolium medium]|nr:hypothetical protein [Trifolium medium]
HCAGLSLACAGRRWQQPNRLHQAWPAPGAAPSAARRPRLEK